MGGRPQRFSERARNWERFGTSIFSQMTALANQWGAVNLAQGFPDFDGPDLIKKRAIQAIQKGPNQYAPSIGSKTLRERIAKRRELTTGDAYDPELEVTVMTGATEGIYVAMQAFLQPGDEIICFTPVYDMYEPAAHVRGAITKFLNLYPPHYEFSAEKLEALISSRTQLIVLNSPQNPSGKVFSEAELKIIAGLAQKHDLLVIADEVYEEIVFDGHRHRSIASLPGMRERTVVVSSTAKTYSLTGWKVGYALAPPALSQTMRNVHQFSVFCTATPLQDAMIAAYDLDESYYEELRLGMSTARDRLAEALSESGWVLTKPQGTYFITADYAKMHKGSDQEVTRKLVEKAGIATIPMSSFYPKGSVRDSMEEASPKTWLRFAFCKTPKTLDEGIRRIKKIDWAMI